MLQVITGTLYEIAGSPVMADYMSTEDVEATATDFGVLGTLARHATLSPMATQALAESFSLTTQFPLGSDSDDGEQGYGAISITMLNPNGVPESFTVELFITGEQLDCSYRVTVYGQRDGVSWVAYDNATNQPLPPADHALFVQHLHTALTAYPSAMVVDA
jgi:hypothetical protein